MEYSIFQSTRSAWSVTAYRALKAQVQAAISIHTLRMERDVTINGDVVINGISIHTLRMERDSVSAPMSMKPRFQSTRSAWSVTD